MCFCIFHLAFTQHTYIESILSLTPLPTCSLVMLQDWQREMTKVCGESAVLHRTLNDGSAIALTLHVQ